MKKTAVAMFAGVTGTPKNIIVFMVRQTGNFQKSTV